MMIEETGGLDLHDHAEHHEDIPQGDEDSKVSEAQQELPDVVTWKVRKHFYKQRSHFCFHHRSVLLRSLPAPHPLPRIPAAAWLFLWATSVPQP